MIKPVLQDDAFLADVSATAGELSNTIRLWWLGQSGFLLQYRGRHLLFDPYLSDSLTKKYAGTEKPHVRMSERVVAPERLDFVGVVTSTHNHTDHLDEETLVPLIRATQAAADRRMGFSYSESEYLYPCLVFPAANEALVENRLSAAVPYLMPMNAWDREKVDTFHFTAVPAAHDKLTMDDRGRHVFLGYVVKAGSSVVYHSGDTVVYDDMVDALRPFNVDVAILPINGKVGNMSGPDAARLAKDIGAKLVIPCHYDMFEFNTASPDAFVAECERLGQPYKVLRAGERWSSTELPT